MSYEEVGIRLRADGGVETLAGVQVVGAGLEKMGQQAERAVPQLDRVGKTAKQTAEAMRMLPAQVTDVVTSLASGMPVWLVAIQQGGQIKDSFGGIVPAARALTSVLTPLNLAIGGTAIGGIALTAAFFSGRGEITAYQRALLLTGGAANATAGALDEMAARTAQVTATQGAAADVLAQLAATGAVSRAQLMQATEAALRMEQMLGVEVEKTVANFAALGRDPVQAAARLNEQYNFLTLSVWEQVRALERQGREAEAAAVAQEALARTGIERAKEMERNLGTLETAWISIGNAAKQAWDFMLGIGRQRTVEQELADVQARLAAPLRRGVDPTQQQARREALRQREAELQEMLRLTQRQADMEAAEAARVRAKVEEDRKNDRNKGPATDPYRALNDQITQRLILASAELQAGEKLNALERERLTLEAQIEEAARKGNAAGAAALRGRADALMTLLRLNEQARQAEADEAAIQRQFQQDRAQAVQTAERRVVALQQEVESIREETGAVGLNAQALAQRQQAQIDNVIAAKEAEIQRKNGLPAYAEEVALLEREVQLLREKRGAVEGRAEARARQASQQSDQQRARGIEEALYEGIASGFKRGMSVAELFHREVTMMFVRQAFKIPVQFVTQGIMSAGSDAAGLGMQLGRFFGSIGSGFMPSFGSFFSSTSTVGTLAPALNPSFVGMGFHGGGIAGGMPTFTRMLPASTWDGAMRRHGGGLAADEVPAVLKRKEGVFTEDQMKALAPVGQARPSMSITLAPTFNVDSRTDRAEVLTILRRGMDATKAELADEMARRMR